MENAEKTKITSFESASPEFKFYYEWSLENRRQNMNFTNEVLRRFVVLTATLLGGGIVLVNKDTMPQFFQALVIVSFLAALSVSFFGIMPFDAHINPGVPREFQDAQERAFVYKNRLIGIAGGCIVFGFVTAFAGLIVHWVKML